MRKARSKHSVATINDEKNWRDDEKVELVVVEPAGAPLCAPR